MLIKDQRTPGSTKSQPQTQRLTRTMSVPEKTVPVSKDEDANSKPSRGTKRFRTASDDLTIEFQSFKKEISEMLEKFLSTTSTRFENIEQQMNIIQHQNTEIHSTNVDIEKAMNSLSADLKSMEDRITFIEKDKKDMQINLENLESKFNYLENFSIKTCIELRNVPKVTNETKPILFGYATMLCNTLDLKLDVSSMVRDVFRLPSRKDKTFSSIAIELNSTLAKSQLLDSIREYNKKHSDQLNSTHIGIQLIKQAIYISELLTPKMKRLLFLAKDYAKSANYDFVWASNGRILMRMATGKPYFALRNEADLSDLKKRDQSTLK